MDDFSTWVLMTAPLTGLALIVVTAIAAVVAHA